MKNKTKNKSASGENDSPIGALYTLKKNHPAFDVVDGPMAGRKFTHGQTYREIPPADHKKFTIVERKK